MRSACRLPSCYNLGEQSLFLYNPMLCREGCPASMVGWMLLGWFSRAFCSSWAPLSRRLLDTHKSRENEGVRSHYTRAYRGAMVLYGADQGGRHL
jgi:hypothetical protein